MADVVGEPARPREPHAGLRGLVEHGVDTVEQRLDRIGTQVGVDELEPRVGRAPSATLRSLSAAA